MSVLIFADAADGQIKKSSFEVLTYGVQLAQKNGWDAAAVVLGNVSDDLSSLGKYGVKKVYHISEDKYNQLDARLYTKALASVVTTSGAQVVVVSNNLTGKAVAPRLSVALKAGLVAGAIGLPDISSRFVVKKAVFSGKAFANINITTAVKIIAISPNSYTTVSGEGTADVQKISGPDVNALVKVTATQKVTGQVPLSEAELVVSGGRGLKGPENWGMVEGLAGLIGAATACSRAVADAHWRPHHEHVGQTGGSIAPNLYVAIGISGAIQHLAGVNRSKVIVVINKDPEAPFFKAADYGIVGDAFEVVPKLIEEVRKFKGVA